MDIVSTLRAMNLDGFNHVGYAADEIERLREALAEAYADADEVLRPRVARLELELAESKANDMFAMKLLAAVIEKKRQFERDWLECCDKLAESQAREKVTKKELRDLRRIACETRVCWMIDELLAQPADDTTLKAALAAERARCLKVYAQLTAWECCDAIRALGEE